MPTKRSSSIPSSGRVTTCSRPRSTNPTQTPDHEPPPSPASPGDGGGSATYTNLYTLRRPRLPAGDSANRHQKKHSAPSPPSSPRPHAGPHRSEQTQRHETQTLRAAPSQGLALPSRRARPAKTRARRRRHGTQAALRDWVPARRARNPVRIIRGRPRPHQQLRRARVHLRPRCRDRFLEAVTDHGLG